MTTAAGFAAAPCPLSMATMGYVCTGTALCVASANILNQWLEVPYDSQMKRTQTRPIVRNLISPLHAVSLGVGVGVAGTVFLAATVNPLVAALGAANIALYAGVYTPMKRSSIANTWVGSVVGAIPPIMGWAAATGGIEPGGLAIAAILYSWQFPHFNALSWNLRGDYSQAGYRMMAVTDPELTKRVALRHTIALLPICWSATFLEVTSWPFLVDSTLVNGYFLYKAWRFYRGGSDQDARKLFFASLWHLPLILLLLVVHKKRAEGSSGVPPVVERFLAMFGVGTENTYTLDTLKEFTGKDSKPIFLAVDGTVFDVSSRAEFYGPDGPYACFAGKDASRGLATMDLNTPPLPGPDDLSDLTDDQRKTLRDWHDSFSEKYPVVGSLAV